MRVALASSHPDPKRQRLDSDVVDQDCPICGVALTLLDELARANHVNRCLDGLSAVDSVSREAAQPTAAAAAAAGPATFSCMICNQDLTPLGLEAREQHVNRCCDAAASREDASCGGWAVKSTPAAAASGPGVPLMGKPVQRTLKGVGGAKENARPLQDLRGQAYTCTACGKDLSRHQFMSRVNHLKKCGVSSAGNGVPTLSSKPSSAVEANSAAPAGGRPPQVASLKGWLEEMDLGKYAPALEAAGVGLAALPSLDDAQLIQMGIVALGARRKLLAAAGKLSQLPRVASPLAVNSATAVSSDIDDAVTSRSGPLASEGKPPVEECARVRSSLMAGHSGGRSREGATTTLAAAGAPKSAVSRLRRPPVRRPIVRIDGALLQGKDRRETEKVVLDCLYPTQPATDSQVSATTGSLQQTTPPFVRRSQVPVCARRAASLVAAPLWSLASAETVEHHHRHHRSQQQQRSNAHHYHHHPSSAPPQPLAIPSPATTGSGGDGLGLTARPSGDDGIGGVVDSAAPSICSEEVVVIDEEDDEEESGMSPVGCSGSVPSDERCVVGLRSESPATAGASQGCPRHCGEPNTAKVKGNGESVGVSGYLAGETRHLQELRAQLRAAERLVDDLKIRIGAAERRELYHLHQR